MSINISRGAGQLNRTDPTEDAVVCLVLSGTAVAGKIALSEPKQIFSSLALVDLGITEANNPLAHRDIIDFYGKAGEGAELNFMLVSDATTLEDICDVANDIARKLITFTQDRGVILLVNRKPAAGYVPTITAGWDADVTAAVSNLNEMAVQYQNLNVPFVGILPALLMDTTKIAEMPLRATLTKDNVAVSAACEKADGHISMGALAGWLVRHQVSENFSQIASGPIFDTAFFPDAVPVMNLKSSWAALNTKAVIFLYKEPGKQGFFFNDDNTMTAISSDYSSISWNRTINKVHRIAYASLVNKLRATVDLNPTTGKVESSLISDWESDVENDIRANMINTGVDKKPEISGVKCTIDPNSDIVNDEVDAEIAIVRRGQAKTFNVKIGYARAIEE
ncbi:DUF2586 family protein [Niabella insulamsoli]|uniref:DUF2586 family protein n=1 Tax=Niabella insulamsoli TaxID=3144874 RepID=UPI0031FCAB1A